MTDQNPNSLVEHQNDLLVEALLAQVAKDGRWHTMHIISWAFDRKVHMDCKLPEKTLIQSFVKYNGIQQSLQLH